MRPPIKSRKTVAVMLLAFVLAGTVSAQKEHNKSSSPLDDQRKEELAVQLFLDGHNFGPGRLDGKWGEFTIKAVERWNTANPDKKIATIENELDRDAGNKPYQNANLLTTYSISAADLKQVGKVADDPAQQASQESLPYESPLEMIAEKFHSSSDFITELNPSIEWDAVDADTSVQVPNVAQPFDINAVPEADDKSKADSSTSENSDEKKSDADQNASINIDMAKEILELRVNEQLVASYPITVGTGSNSPEPGEWKVNVVAWRPTFRYDEKMLKEGIRSDNAHMLPSGPNNPVGIVWVGLNADGIGIHGTSNPDDIGRNSSAGCIRLSNWDALNFARQIQPEASVTIENK